MFPEFSNSRANPRLLRFGKNSSTRRRQSSARNARGLTGREYAMDLECERQKFGSELGIFARAFEAGQGSDLRPTRAQSTRPHARKTKL